MNDYYEKSNRALQLAGMSERTQECYTRAVRMVADFYGKSPDQIAEPELEEYFLHRKNLSKWSPNTMRICYCGIRFFYQHVLQRDWHRKYGTFFTFALSWKMIWLFLFKPLSPLY